MGNFRVGLIAAAVFCLAAGSAAADDSGRWKAQAAPRFADDQPAC